jgi:polyhydroxyalkanoate synthase subunit PhaC
MMPFDIRPDAVMQEVSAYSKKLTHGLQNLMEVGEISTGVTPKTAVYHEDKLTLFRFEQPKDAIPNKVPLLIVYALVNRPYMTDIQENRSTVKALMAAGQDVYLIDWGYPDRADRYLTLDD